MISGPLGDKKYSALTNEYASLLGVAVHRHRARTAEHSARVEAELASKLKSEFINALKFTRSGGTVSVEANSLPEGAEQWFTSAIRELA